MRNALKLSSALIGLYLVVAYATGSGKVITASTTGAGGVIKAFQGR
ncbi:MAG: hypothetical protein ACR2MO_08585 [Acidimicrobiales bacterium]